MNDTMHKPVSYGVSVGPGDKNQITLEAIEAIRKADVIFLPSFPKEECVAYKIIKNIMPDIDEKELCPETFTMSKDVNVMHKRHEEIFANVKSCLDEGKSVAFLTLGEVVLYSTYLYIHEMLVEAGYNSVLVNGISSVQAICARLGNSLAMGKDEVHIFPNADNIEKKLTYDGTKVFMKTRRNLDEVIGNIQKHCKENPRVQVFGISNCGMQGQIIARSSEELSNLEGYFTVIIVK